MYYRQTSTEFNARKGDSNRRALRRLVGGEPAPGVLAYAGDEPVGWCAVAPRTEYSRLSRSRNLAPVDDEPVWSVPCLFVARNWRRRGVTARLLQAAAAHARTQGARILEGYPLVPQPGVVPAAFAWNGFLPAFEAAGFAVAARRSPRQVVVRRRLDRSIRA
jgi:GNAT superfamily N-acetyltransferase